MVSALPYLVLLCELTISSFSVEIIRGPETVTNATVGGIAKFVCIINSESDLPWWNIDGYDIDVTNLPPGLQFESNGFSKILTVNPVLQVLNNSCFYCYLLFYDSRIESLRAKLIIQPPTISHPMSSTKTAILSLGSSSAKHNILSPTYIHSTWQNISAPAEKSSVYVIPQTSQYYLDTTPMSSIRQVTPISSVVILTPWYLLHQNLIFGVSTAIMVTIVLAFVIVAIIAWIYRRKRSKGVSDRHKQHVYEEVFTVNPVVHQNPAYANPMTMKLEENPAYVSTHKLH